MWWYIDYCYSRTGWSFFRYYPEARTFTCSAHFDWSKGRMVIYGSLSFDCFHRYLREVGHLFSPWILLWSFAALRHHTHAAAEWKSLILKCELSCPNFRNPPRCESVSLVAQPTSTRRLVMAAYNSSDFSGWTWHGVPEVWVRLVVYSCFLTFDSNFDAIE